MPTSKSNTTENILILDKAKNQTRLYRVKRTILKTLTLSTILIDPLYSYFLFTAIYKVIKNTEEELGVQSNKFIDIFFTAFIIFITTMSYLYDITVVNPIEEAEAIASLEDEELDSNLQSINNLCKQKTIKIAIFTNQIIANSAYFINSTASAVSVAYLTRLNGLRWGVGIPVTLLNMIYNNMLTRRKVKTHTYKFMWEILNLFNGRSIIKMFQSPLTFLEVIIQVLTRAIYGGISTGYVMEELVAEFYENGINKASLLNGLVLYALLSAFFNDIFSRTLNVQRKFFNPQFEKLAPSILKSVRVNPSVIMVDGFLSMIRAISAGTLLYRHISTHPILKIIFVITVAGLIFSHNFYVRHSNHLKEKGLDIFESNAFINSSTEVISVDKKDTTPSKIFDFIKENLKSSKLQRNVTFINFGMITANWMAFLGFLITLNKLLKNSTNLNLDFFDLVCIQQLWGNTSLANDSSFAQENMVENISYYYTKIFLEKRKALFGFKAFFKSKKEYPYDYLMQQKENVKNKFSLDTELEEAALITHVAF
ncbi:hypothetical protein A3F66_01675 [candidate division TM6 bacterium RIFCSPHIGHO2_12_FULL_32_22]|nr:MAG: hypothetical protein A3F66_01675 [candidate division TM6 bacterium RIFCSPHIGHO2_12_FULL_32_22]